MLFKASMTALVDVIRLAAIFKAVDAVAQQAPLTLAVVKEDLAIENLDKFSHRLLLFGLDILTVEDGPPRRLPVAHASQPASDLALDLPEQVFVIDIQRTGDNGFGHNVHRFKDRV